MTDPNTAPAQERAAWHRYFAVSAFNRSWDLLEAPNRDPAGDDELLAVAFASRWHWGEVGTSENQAFGDHQIAKVAAGLGLADLAVRFARRALAVAEAEGWEGWKWASVCEGMARAHQAAGDTTERNRWLDRTREGLAAVDDPEERAVIEDQARQIAGW